MSQADLIRRHFMTWYKNRFDTLGFILLRHRLFRGTSNKPLPNIRKKRLKVK